MSVKRKKSMLKKEIIDFGKGFMFIAPNFIGYLCFTIIPVFISFMLCFTKWNINESLSNVKFVGFMYFKQLFSDENFFKSIENNFTVMLIFVPLSTIIGLFLAVILNRHVYAKGVLRALFFLPYITNIVAVCTTWTMLYQPSYGPINGFLRSVGLQNPPGWLVSEKWALLSIIIVFVWINMGYNMVIFMAGLKNIPNEIKEAATIDGVNSIEMFRYITLPLLSSTTFFVLITGTISSLKFFTPVSTMTEGGPGNSTMILAYYLYISAFRFYKLNYSSVIGLALFLIVLLITLIQWVGQKKWVHYT